MEPVAGAAPVTSPLPTECSTAELHRLAFLYWSDDDIGLQSKKGNVLVVSACQQVITINRADAVCR